MQRTCPVCGTVFETKSSQRVYCSQRCKDRNEDMRWRERRGLAPVPVAKTLNGNCLWCGEAFEYRYYEGSPHKKFCREACGKLYRKAGKRPRKDVPPPRSTCAQCSKPFNGLPGALYCCDRCRRDAHNTRGRQRYVYVPRFKVKEPITKVCGGCGESFEVSLRASIRRYCSEKCMERANGRDEQHRRRAAKRNAKVEKVNAIDIFNRDNWTCQLCGEPVQRDAKVPHFLAPTLDHIVPLAKGGSHTKENLQLAHFICNSRKSDREVGQFSLSV